MTYIIAPHRASPLRNKNAVQSTVQMGAWISTTNRYWQTPTHRNEEQQTCHWRRCIVFCTSGSFRQLPSSTNLDDMDGFTPDAGSMLSSSELVAQWLSTIRRGRTLQRRGSVDATDIKGLTPSLASLDSDESEKSRREDKILADFARFEWPRRSCCDRSEDENGECPSLTNSLVLEREAESPDDEPSDEEMEALKRRELLAKARQLRSGPGMSTFDEELLKHLRRVHDAWRKSFDFGRQGELACCTERFPPCCVQTWNAKETCPDADELLDALERSFLPSL